MDLKEIEFSQTPYAFIKVAHWFAVKVSDTTMMTKELMMVNKKTFQSSLT